MSFIINTLILVSNSKYIEDQNTNKESLISYFIIRHLKWKLYYFDTATLIEHRVLKTDLVRRGAKQRKWVYMRRREKQNDGNGTRANYREAHREVDGLHGGLPIGPPLGRLLRSKAGEAYIVRSLMAETLEFKTLACWLSLSKRKRGRPWVILCRWCWCLELVCLWLSHVYVWESKERGWPQVLGSDYLFIASQLLAKIFSYL